MFAAPFTLDGRFYDYLRPGPGNPEGARSWKYGHYPKVMATLPTTPAAETVYAHAARWNGDRILVEWEDDDRRKQWTWVDGDAVEPVTDSEWDIWEYHRCPVNIRGVRWGNRLPGFLPA